MDSCTFQIDGWMASRHRLGQELLERLAAPFRGRRSGGTRLRRRFGWTAGIRPCHLRLVGTWGRRLFGTAVQGRRVGLHPEAVGGRMSIRAAVGSEWIRNRLVFGEPVDEGPWSSYTSGHAIHTRLSQGRLALPAIAAFFPNSIQKGSAMRLRFQKLFPAGGLVPHPPSLRPRSEGARNPSPKSRRVSPRRLFGGFRRTFLLLFRPGYVQARLAARRGACRRCGACCQINWPCRHLFFEKGLAGCRLYGTLQPRICRQFPIDEGDLADRDAASPERPCGFWWDR